MHVIYDAPDAFRQRDCGTRAGDIRAEPGNHWQPACVKQLCSFRDGGIERHGSAIDPRITHRRFLKSSSAAVRRGV
jgi:hypothetical protein